MSTSKTIVFFGTDDFSAISLQALLDAGFPVSAVVTKPDSHQGRGRVLTAPKVKTIALEHDIKVLQPTRLSDIADDIAALGPVAGVLVSYGKIIPQSIIDLFTPGIINVHPSLLPKYRGPSPIETAILNGDTETGVSIMSLSAAMDAGPVYYQTNVSLSGNETSPALESHLGALGAEKLVAILPQILDETLQPVEQDDSQATYCQLLQKSDAVLDPSTITVAEAERRIRAYLAFPKTKMTLLGQSVVVLKAHIGTGDGSLAVACKDGTLIIDELIGPSGRAMTGAAFLNGYAH